MSNRAIILLRVRFRQLAPDRFQSVLPTVLQLFVLCLEKRFLRPDHQIGRWFHCLLVCSEQLTNFAFYPVSANSPTHFSGDGESEAVKTNGVWAIIHDKIFCAESVPVVIDLLKFPSPPQPLGGPKAIPAHIRHKNPASCQTARRFLPLRRRRLRTSRPPFVFIRARNPCLRFLLELFG